MERLAKIQPTPWTTSQKVNERQLVEQVVENFRTEVFQKYVGHPNTAETITELQKLLNEELKANARAFNTEISPEMWPIVKISEADKSTIVVMIPAPIILNDD